MSTAETRHDENPLLDDMRWLTAALGRVIHRIEGKETFDAVETLRTACRDRRRQDADADSLRYSFFDKVESHD